jgi:hypothetical protein
MNKINMEDLGDEFIVENLPLFEPVVVEEMLSFTIPSQVPPKVIDKPSHAPATSATTVSMSTSGSLESGATSGSKQHKHKIRKMHTTPSKPSTNASSPHPTLVPTASVTTSGSGKSGKKHSSGHKKVVQEEGSISPSSHKKVSESISGVGLAPSSVKLSSEFSGKSSEKKVSTKHTSESGKASKKTISLPDPDAKVQRSNSSPVAQPLPPAAKASKSKRDKVKFISSAIYS